MKLFTGKAPRLSPFDVGTLQEDVPQSQQRHLRFVEVRKNSEIHLETPVGPVGAVSCEPAVENVALDYSTPEIPARAFETHNSYWSDASVCLPLLCRELGLDES